MRAAILGLDAVLSPPPPVCISVGLGRIVWDPPRYKPGGGSRKAEKPPHLGG